MPLTKSEAIALITKLANKELMTELLYLRDEIDREPPPEPGDEDYEFYEPYDLLDAFEDAADQCDYSDAPKKWKMHIREIEIALGWYVVVTEEELSRTIVVSSSGRPCKKYAFIHKGQKYKFNSR